MPTEEDWQNFINGGDNEGGENNNNENTPQDGDSEDDENFGQIGDSETNYVEQDVHEMFSTISESFELHNGTASVQVRCDWDKRYDVVSSFLEGGDEHEPKGYQPWNDFNLEGTEMVATSVRIEPLQTKYESAGQAIKYKFALITLNYSMMATEVRVESTNQYMTIAPNNLYWFINGAPVAVAQEEAPGVRLASYDLTLSHPHIPSKTKDGTPIQAFEGFVNDSDIEVFYNGVELKFKRQTLLCTAPSINAGANLFGMGFNNVSVRLSYNPIGHNEFFNPLQGQDEEISDITAHKVQLFKSLGKSGSSSETYKRVVIYPERDFVPLFELFKIFVTDTGTPEFDPNDFVGTDPENTGT